MGEILYESGEYFVVRATFGRSDGFAVYRNGATAAERIARIGYSGATGLARAIDEIARRRVDVRD